MHTITRNLLMGALAASLSLSGCTTYDAYTGEQKTSKTAIGAGAGAGTAALISYIANRDASSKDRKKRMLTAAGIGAIAGGGVGYYMDSQEAKLRKQLRDSGVSVVRDGENINLVMPGNITFDTNSENLKASFNDVLKSVALVLEEYDKTIIAVSGYTDSVGSEAYNQQLSEKRARSVADFLKASGIKDVRFEIVGFGEKYPVADNATEEGRALNRRVELTLIPIKSDEKS